MSFEPLPKISDDTLADRLVTDGLPDVYVNLYDPLRRKSFEATRRLALECAALHVACSAKTNASQTPYQGPRRLLQISGSARGLQLRLVEFESWSEDLRYTTLSHCWGPDGCPRQLKISNRNEYLLSIDLASLPRTFFESVVCTAALGLDYIWIDALCIIQDSEEDWSTEGLNMSSIYSGSFLNLIATAAMDSNGGLFCQTDSRLTSPLCVKSNWLGTELEAGTWLIRVAEHGAGGLYKRYTNERSALAKRAWVYQERFLAPRSLLFAADTVRFQCQKGTISEAMLNQPESVSGVQVPVTSLCAIIKRDLT